MSAKCAAARSARLLPRTRRGMPRIAGKMWGSVRLPAARKGCAINERFSIEPQAQNPESSIAEKPKPSPCILHADPFSSPLSASFFLVCGKPPGQSLIRSNLRKRKKLMEYKAKVQAEAEAPSSRKTARRGHVRHFHCILNGLLSGLQGCSPQGIHLSSFNP